MVPIISSASYPSRTTAGIFIAFKIVSMIGTAILIASGVSCLLALYSEKISVLARLPPLSKQTARWSGFSRLITSNKELVNPKIADVSSPFELILGFLINA
ncbi:MAG: Uncharacterised protein [Flavobacterium sp. SCGC AAA160-P02]|nr:MAG: Uncharacterised protein [Flavobacterium sp. SCGC AAA160-P02]